MNLRVFFGTDSVASISGSRESWEYGTIKDLVWYLENSELESDGGVGRRYQPVGATSTACTLADLGFSKSTSEIPL